MLTIAIDIDGVLCYECKANKWSSATPIKNAVEKVKKLAKTNSIFYYTARPEVDRCVTAAWLYDNNFPIAPLFMGKPQADIYVDDRSVKLLEEVC